MITVLLWVTLVVGVIAAVASVTAAVMVYQQSRRPRYPTNVKQPTRKAR